MNGNMHLSSSSKFLHSFLTSPDRGCHLSTHFQPSMSSTRLLWVWQHRFSERCTNPLKARFLLSINADIERWVFSEIDLSDALNRAIKMRRICIRRDAPCHRASACVRVSERVCARVRAWSCTSAGFNEDQVGPPPAANTLTKIYRQIKIYH